MLELLKNEEARDIAEYAVMLAVILVIVVGTITPRRLEREHGFFPSREFDSVESSTVF